MQVNKISKEKFKLLNNKNIIEQNFFINYRYNILFTREVFHLSNTLLFDLFQPSAISGKIKIGFVIDQGLLDHWPNLHQAIESYIHAFPSLQLVAEPLVITGGELAKNSLDTMKEVLNYIHQKNIDRHAYLIAMGGGAILDMVGFAAAIGHRGIRHIRMPTTVLSQNDSGVGVKNGINYYGKKNFLGTFSPPVAVINDFNFLNTLDERDWRSGMSEAVKVALIKDATFFYWLEDHAMALSHRDTETMEKLIFDCAALHVDHISSQGDPFEMGSSRPLDFGHWAAHKLEQLTEFEVKHGEAVAIGIALDLAYAVTIDICDQEIFERVYQVLTTLGFKLFHPLLLEQETNALNPEVYAGLEEFRTHLGGQLTITLIKEIGIQFNVHEMNKNSLDRAALLLYQKSIIHAN
ncbi:MAG: 3-dehydroquinate synthase [Cyclobacteriaceae bacterium]|nr:3-dehydroquinate synthase [Cyclobacteriaceae bacterium]